MAEVRLKMVPMDDNVLVTPEDQSEMSSGEHGVAIDLSKQQKKPPVRGVVCAVGPGKLLDSGERQPMDVKPGERIFFSRYTGEEIEAEGGKVVIMKRHEILCVLRPKLEEKGESVEEE